MTRLVLVLKQALAFLSLRFAGFDQNVAFNAREREAEIAAPQVFGRHARQFFAVGIGMFFHHLFVQTADHQHMTAAKQDEIKRGKPDHDGGVVERCLTRFERVQQRQHGDQAYSRRKDRAD